MTFDVEVLLLRPRTFTERRAVSPARRFFVAARDLRDDLIQAVTVFPTQPQHSISILRP